MKRIFYIIFIQLLTFQIAKSCSCAIPDNIELSEYIQTDVIYSGKVFRITKNEGFKSIEFQVEKNYKGLPVGTETIILRTNIEGSMCGLEVTEGERWLIWANDFEGNLYSGLCSRSAKVDKAEKQLAFVNTLKIKSANQWFVNDRLLGTGNIINGKAEGSWKYVFNGGMQEVGNYVKGKRNGAWEIKNNNGISRITVYKDGELQSVKDFEAAKKVKPNLKKNSG